MTRVLYLIGMLSVLGACGGGDDDTAGDVDAGQSATLNGNYRITDQHCISGQPDCRSDLASADRMTIVTEIEDQGGNPLNPARVSITWLNDGNTVYRHSGEMQGFCARLLEGLDGRWHRDYIMCPRSASDDSLMTANIEWVRTAPAPDGTDAVSFTLARE